GGRCAPRVGGLRAEAAGAPADSGLAPADRDRVLAYGERLAAELLAAALSQRGTPARAVFAGDAGLVTDERFGQATPLPEAAGRIARALAERSRLPVVTGFVGCTPGGRVTPLGRAGPASPRAIVAPALAPDD